MTDPIRRIVNSKGEVRYRFIVDVGRKPDGRRDQRCSTFPTLREARAALAQIKADRSRGNLVKPTKVTFKELCTRWLASKHDVREISQQGYRYALRQARAQLGRTRVQDIARSDIERTIRSLRDDHGLSHRSIVYALGTIKQVLAYGITEGVVAVNVAASVKAPRKVHGDSRPHVVWEHGELLAFRALADQDELAAAWRLTLCGLRRSEVMGLRWEHVDLERGEVVIRSGRVALAGGGRRTVTEEPKSSASRRTVEVEQVQPGTVALLRALRARQAADRLALGIGYPDNGLVVVDALGRPMSPSGYSDRFAILCRNAGVRQVHLHAIRHTLALMMHRAGIAPADAAALLGHTVQTHLAVYVPLTEKGARTAASGLSAAIARVR